MSSPFLPILSMEEIRQSAPTPRIDHEAAAKPAWVLHRGPIRHRPDILTVEPANAGEGLESITGLADWLETQLAARAQKPAIIMIGRATDPFQADSSPHSEMSRVIQVLVRHGVSLWLTTRNTISVSLLETLAAHRNHVRVTVPLMTLERDVQRILEPEAATPAERLQLIADLKAHRIPFEIALEPLLPGLTDAPDRLQALLGALADLEVGQVTAGYLVLRPDTRDRLSAALESGGWHELVLSAYDDGPLLRDGRELAQYLLKAKRQRGYALLMSLAAVAGISVRLSELSNPDFRRPVVESHHHPRSLLESFRSHAEPALFADEK